MSIFPIFKVNKMSDKNITDTIYVFYGSQFGKEIDDPATIFYKTPGDKLFSNIFNVNELAEMKDIIERRRVIFINQTIHIDDSIGVIKLKIFEAILKEASMSELYLYCLKYEKLNPVTVYQNLTQNDKLPLTNVRMNQLLLNIYDESGRVMEFDLEDKIQYTFDDILKLDLIERTYLVGNPLGQKFVFSNEYPFITDPFCVTDYDTLLENSRNELTTLNANLLLESLDPGQIKTPIFRNTIYLCLAKNVFEFADKTNISAEYTSKIYFPFLYKENITSLYNLNTKRTELIETTLKNINKDTERTFENVDMLYNIYNKQTQSAKFSENTRQTGIKSLKVVIYPEFKIKIPIDVIFKLVHATQDFPLIKYNPETRQENIYRLFAPEITIDGRKIPYLQKTTIFKLIKTIGKSRSVAVYTTVKYNGMTFNMTCEFEENGNISVYPLADFDTPILLSSGENIFENTDELIKLTLNPLIEQIKPFFEQSGLNIPLFNSITSLNTEIRDMKFQTMYNITSPIDISKIRGCISSIFVIESDNFKKGIQLRYRRVSNFNKRDSQDAFIIEKIDQGLRIDEIIEELLQQYDDLNEEIATDLIIKIRSELEITRGANKHRALMVKINPGFKTTMDINLITSELTINISGINDIYYLRIIPVYINTIIRITQDISSTKVDKSKIKTLCSGEEISDIEFGEIISKSEQPLYDNKVPVISNESLSYNDNRALNQGENMDELLDMLGFEHDDSSDFHGGDGSTDSDKFGSSESSKSVTSESLSTNSTSSSPIKVPQQNPSDKKVSNTSSTPSSTSSEVSDISITNTSTEEQPVPTKLPELVNNANKIVPVDKDDDVDNEVSNTSSTPSSTSSEVSDISITNTPTEEQPVPTKPPKLVNNANKVVPVDKDDDVDNENIYISVKKTKTEGAKLKTKALLQKNIQSNAEKMENTVKDITGMKLKYPNPFSERLEEKMPQLFVTSKNDKFDSYSRMCPFNLSDRRQPVILTKEEKDKIIADHPGEIDQNADFIEYGTDPKDSSKKFYYTCPRYWCLLTNTVVTEQDILDGKCGQKVDKIEDAIIPKKATTVPRGKYVYQFYDGDENEKKYPGFHKNKTPSGLCIPCCFSNWKTSEMKNRRDICQGKFDGNNAEKVSKAEANIEEQLRKEISESEHYVKGPEKYGPQLGEHRWGFLPVLVEKFLHHVNNDCQISKTNTTLKTNHPCLLRRGVEVSPTQSFIACIANIIFYAQTYIDKNGNTKPLSHKFIPNTKYDVPTIKDMKALIIKAIDLDNFVKYQNGDLVTSFADPNLEVKIEEYSNSKLYKTMMKNKNRLIKQGIKEDEMVDTSKLVATQFIIKVAQALENFKKYLTDDKIIIDYTYLWDVLSMPNPIIFEAGINLIILEIPEDDSTNNIELICPTNHYSFNAFDARKRSVILIKRDNYFEPVYGYFNDGTNIHVTKTFTEYDKTMPKPMKAVFEKIIKPTLGQKCKSYISRPNEYRFKQAPILDKLINELVKKKYSIRTQVLNFQGKVIGILVKNKQGLDGYIPCYPSALTTLKQVCQTLANSKGPTEKKMCDYDVVFMNDDIWKSYEDTLKFMKQYYDYVEPKDIDNADCSNPKYFCRVVEDELITGFLTNTNQFIPIKDPIPISTTQDNLKTININNMLVADINTLTNQTVDTKRVEFIKKIQLETNFYNVFRNTIRILFNDYLNSEKRKQIRKECNKKYTLYKTQLDKVIEMLHQLVNDNIVFTTEMKLPYKFSQVNENELHSCLSKSDTNCEITGSICRMTQNKCQLVIPKENLVNGTDNEIYFYGRMADELIRYNRIKSFVFKPTSYLSFGKLQYNLRNNEIIVLQSLLNQDFFDNLIPADINKYAKYNTFDTANPIFGQTYDNEMQLDDIINPHSTHDCRSSKPQLISSSIWRVCFPEEYKEIVYKDSIHCPFHLIIDLTDKLNGLKITVDNIKEHLLEEYEKITENFRNIQRIKTIISILREEAQFDANQLKDGTMNFTQMIMNDGFKPVNFDLWLLLVRYKIPSIFISNKPISETRFNHNEFVCYKGDGAEYVFIITPGMYRRTNNKLPEYKMIVDEKGKVNIELHYVTEGQCIRNIHTAINNYITIEDYIDVVFETDNTTTYHKKQKGVRNIEFEIVSDVVEGNDTIEIKQKEKKKIKRLKSTHILEEADDFNEIKHNVQEAITLDKLLPVEELPIIPVKHKKTRRHNKQNVTVNPHGKKKTRRKLPENFSIEDDI